MIDLRRWSALATVLAIALAAPVPSIAQQAPPAQPQTRPATKAPPAKSPAKENARPADQASESQLRGKVEHLEEQLADMQVVIGTLESLARGGNSGPVSAAGRASPGGSGGGVDQARIDSLETQIRALTGQLEQLSNQVRQLSSGRRAEVDPQPPAASPVPRDLRNAGVPPLPPARGDGFGSTTVSPAERDPIGRMLGTPETPQPASASAGAPPPGGGNPRELYETAYGYLLQQDYGASEASFEEFLRRYPNDRLTPDAQYWYGETLYVQKRYKQAGQAFLAVVEKHKSSAKVPNSLLKLAQSLDQLGQKDCGIFNELETRHANAPADVRTRARALKQRQGC